MSSASASASPKTAELRGVIAAHGDEFDALLAKYSATNPRYFGSVARGTARADSDIDIVVDMDPADGNILMRAAGLLEESRELFGREDLDVLPAQILKQTVVASALVDAVPL